MADWISENDLGGLLQAGSRVYVGGSTNEPAGLLDVLQKLQLPDIRYIQQPIAAVNQRDLSELGPDCTQDTWFMTPFLEAGLKARRVRFTPMHMRAIFDDIAAREIDVALLMAARDVEGTLRFGPNVDYVAAAQQAAKKVVVEVSDTFIAPVGCPAVADSADYLYASQTPGPLFPETRIDDTSRSIGQTVASLIQDGDCLQTGIGAVPAAILSDLADKNDLGFHGGLLDDGVMNLILSGNLNGQAKSVDKGRHITGMALGSERLLDWLKTADNVVFRSANYTHEVSVIRQLDNFVSINSAVEIDLFGQVNAEVTGGRQISGTGGSVDFMRAAKSSRGGRSIIALSSTARRGSISRIVPKVELVTALRTDVDIVVTEFGIAALKKASLHDRAALLTEIAHPDFRDELRAAWQKMV